MILKFPLECGFCRSVVTDEANWALHSNCCTMPMPLETGRAQDLLAEGVPLQYKYMPNMEWQDVPAGGEVYGHYQYRRTPAKAEKPSHPAEIDLRMAEVLEVALALVALDDLPITPFGLLSDNHKKALQMARKAGCEIQVYGKSGWNTVSHNEADFVAYLTYSVAPFSPCTSFSKHADGTMEIKFQYERCGKVLRNIKGTVCD